MTARSTAPARQPKAARLQLSRSLLLSLALFLGFLVLYARTAAPSVLSGDSAEFQLAAPLLGVPHPTTYPLYILLGKLATLVVPLGDAAYRVTLASSAAAAVAVALLFTIAARATGSYLAALVGAIALGVAPGLWNAATIAEVYALLAALLAALGCLLMSDDRSPAANHRRPATDGRPLTQGRSDHGERRWHLTAGRLGLAAFVAGLGLTHHGLFALTGLPLFAGAVATRLFAPRGGTRRPPAVRASAPAIRAVMLFLLGLTPWLFPLVQYARFRPFDAFPDFGLPRHYFWGAPVSLAEVVGLMAGGPLAGGIFRLPSPADALDVAELLVRRLWFEFGPLGGALGAAGCLALAARDRRLWIGSAWVAGATIVYVLLLGPAVQDAPAFTLPLLLPWALWVACGAEVIAGLVERVGLPALRSRQRAAGRAFLLALVVATLAWGYTRIPHSSKRQLWLFRSFGEATLEQVAPGAVVITHWEQGMTLQYLRLVEGQRPDVWVDVVEPGDEPWVSRIERYRERPVYFVGGPADVAELPVELVRDEQYADVYRLKGEGGGGR